jgi:hypothetical protein
MPFAALSPPTIGDVAGHLLEGKAGVQNAAEEPAPAGRTGDAGEP